MSWHILSLNHLKNSNEVISSNPRACSNADDVHNVCLNAESLEIGYITDMNMAPRMGNCSTMLPLSVQTTTKKHCQLNEFNGTTFARPMERIIISQVAGNRIWESDPGRARDIYAEYHQFSSTAERTNVYSHDVALRDCRLQTAILDAIAEFYRTHQELEVRTLTDQLSAMSAKLSSQNVGRRSTTT